MCKPSHPGLRREDWVSRGVDKPDEPCAWVVEDTMDLVEPPVSELPKRGRDCYQRRRWAAAFDALSQADEWLSRAQRRPVPGAQVRDLAAARRLDSSPGRGDPRLRSSRGTAGARRCPLPARRDKSLAGRVRPSRPGLPPGRSVRKRATARAGAAAARRGPFQYRRRCHQTGTRRSLGAIQPMPGAARVRRDHVGRP
jgi:hypothetical protein